MKSNKTIAVINDPKVTLGSISDDGILKYFAWELEWESLNPNDDYIILGGHMGAYNVDEFPYLIDEKKWLSKVIPLGTKVLGICLGAQLIADAMGGEAYLSNNIEFGFKDLHFHQNYDFLNRYKDIKVFLWHRDTFSLPPTAELIASTDFPQIFKINNTYAVQFHPEINIALYDDWFDSEVSKKELSNFDTKSAEAYIRENQVLNTKMINEFYKDWKKLEF
tara:strand:- start:1869 stop:2531 length:663 start_codon:yes stop_codon:yes gene_type:complete